MKLLRIRLFLVTILMLLVPAGLSFAHGVSVFYSVPSFEEDGVVVKGVITVEVLNTSQT